MFVKINLNQCITISLNLYCLTFMDTPAHLSSTNLRLVMFKANKLIQYQIISEELHMKKKKNSYSGK